MSVSADFTKLGPGTCNYCGADKDEVVTVSFKDGSITGALCFNDLRKFLRMKLGNGQPAAKSAAPTAIPISK